MISTTAAKHDSDACIQENNNIKLDSCLSSPSIHHPFKNKYVPAAWCLYFVLFWLELKADLSAQYCHP